MKKFGLKIIGFVLAFIIAFPCCFAGGWDAKSAGRAMTAGEQVAFKNVLSGIIDNYDVKKIRPLISSHGVKGMHTLVINHIDRWPGYTDKFDKEHFIFGTSRQWEDDFNPKLVNFETAMKCYHDAILSGKALSCRAHALFVLKELMDKGIECYYVQLNFNELKCWSVPHKYEVFPHDVVLYRTEKGMCVCDFSKAFVNSLVYRYADERTKGCIAYICGSHDLTRYMSMPVEEYINRFVELNSESIVCSPPTGIGVPLERVRLCFYGSAYPWLQIAVTDKIKATKASVILDHDHTLTPYQAEAYATGWKPSEISEEQHRRLVVPDKLFDLVYFT